MGISKNTRFSIIQLVIFNYEEEKTQKHISNILRVPRSTVGDITRRYKNENRLELRTSTDRRKIFSSREERTILKLIKLNPQISAPKLTQTVNADFSKSASTETVRRILRSNGLHGRSAREKN